MAQSKAIVDHLLRAISKDEILTSFMVKGNVLELLITTMKCAHGILKMHMVESSFKVADPGLLEGFQFEGQF